MNTNLASQAQTQQWINDFYADTGDREATRQRIIEEIGEHVKDWQLYRMTREADGLCFGDFVLAVVGVLAHEWQVYSIRQQRVVTIVGAPKRVE